MYYFNRRIYLVTRAPAGPLKVFALSKGYAMNIKSLFFGLIITVLFTNHALAKAETKQEADAFLAKYCIELGNVIEGTYKEQVKLAKNENWYKFEKMGAIIGSVADVYSKLCK